MYIDSMNSYENEYKLAKYLLEKYSDIINEREQRTIGEIKDLASGNDLSIQAMIEEFKPKPFNFEENYENVLKKVFDYIQQEITFVDPDLGLNYWMSGKEILELKIADDEDLAVFLCATMKSLGDDKAEVIIAELDNLKTHSFVITEISGEFLLLDPTQKENFEKYKGSKIEVIKNYEYQKQKIKRFLYRFNSSKYEQFLE